MNIENQKREQDEQKARWNPSSLKKFQKFEVVQKGMGYDGHSDNRQKQMFDDSKLKRKVLEKKKGKMMQQ